MSNLRSLFRRLRGALSLGVLWGLAWGVIGGTIMEGLVDPHGKILDMWPQTLAILGFLSGTVFSVALGLGARRRRFHALSLPRFGALGAVAGCALGCIALTLGIGSGITPLWARAALFLGPVTILSTLSALGTLAVARWAEQKSRDATLDAGVSRVEVEEVWKDGQLVYHEERTTHH